MQRLVSAFGIVVLLSLAWLLSNNRRAVPWRVIGWGLVLQFSFGLFILQTGPGLKIFEYTRVFVSKLMDFTTDGAHMVFGALALNPSVPEHATAYPPDKPLGFFFFFGALTTIIFFASLMSLLYHLGIMQKIVQVFAIIMVRTMGTSGAESLSAAANIFVGQTEAPLMIKPYMAQMTMSELMAVMTVGFATIASGVFAVYANFGIDAGHLLAASVMSAPAGLIMAKLMHPDDGEPLTRGVVRVQVARISVNAIDAAATGASDGMRLVINVAAMLLAFVSLVAMINYGLGQFDEFVLKPIFQHKVGLSLARILGTIFSPLALAMGIERKDVFQVGTILGTQISLNEFVAFLTLKDLRDVVSPRTFVMTTYALCGFANFSSIAIQLGGIGEMVPARRQDLAKIGVRAMTAGALACYMTACVAGVLLDENEVKWRYVRDLEKRVSKVTQFEQPIAITVEFATNGTSEQKEVAQRVLTKLREMSGPTQRDKSEPRP